MEKKRLPANCRELKRKLFELLQPAGDKNRKYSGRCSLQESKSETFLPCCSLQEGKQEISQSAAACRRLKRYFFCSLQIAGAQIKYILLPADCRSQN
jgi:hypothetical protein